MPGGIHVEVAIGDPGICQVSPYSSGQERTVTGVSKSPHPDENGQLIEEFTVRTTTDVEPDGGATVESSINQLFDSGEREVFRFTRETPQSCACELVEAHGCPVRDVTADNGTLYVTFVTPDHDTLQSTLEELTDRYDDMSVCRLLQSEESEGTEQSVVVDIGALTDRQHEVLTKAHELGYFEHPRTTSAADVAAQLGIAKSTFAEHLSAAQRNLLEELLDN